MTTPEPENRVGEGALADEASALVPMPPRRRSLRRIGCSVLLIIWFAVLLLPCLLVYVATTGEVALATGSLPGQEVRLWLMTEDRDRGIGISTASVAGGSSATTACLQTDVRYLMWAGRGENSTYCECYTRSSADAAWIAAESLQGACPAR